MKSTLLLKSRFDDFPESEVEFYPQYPKGDDIDEQNPVFEDGHYHGFLRIGETAYDIESVELFLNGDVFIGHGIKDENVGEMNTYHIRFEDERGNETVQPFQLLYDLLVLSVRIIFAGQSEPVFLHSRHLSCISKQPEDTQNAADMLKSLWHIEDDKIVRWMFSDRAFDRVEDNSRTQTELRQQLRSHKSPTVYIQLIESIAVCYQTNLQYFNALARHSITKVNVVREYSKARNVSREGFQWIMQNTHQLSEVSNRDAIRYRGSRYMPRNILIQEPVNDRDVYENQVVLSFLTLVLKNVLTVKEMVETDVSERENTLQKIQETVREGYQAPAISTLWKLPLEESKTFCEKILRLLNQLELLYAKYSEIFNCTKFDIKSFPRKTKTFQEVKPYSQVFEHIMKWFKFGDFDMKQSRVIFNLRTLDKLFEYYSLYRLLKMCCDAGFDDVQDKPTAVSYRYNVLDSRFENETDIANTYYLEKDDCLLTLYYQPVIHSDRFENDLTIFRTTINRRYVTSCYYTPDFLIKLSRQNQNPVYVVLDSKYSNRLSILRRNEENSQTNYLDKTVLKYSSQLAVRETSESPRMIWILQGRGGEERTAFRFHNSPLAKRYLPKTSYGIISVNTRDNTLNELWSEIKKFVGE